MAEISEQTFDESGLDLTLSSAAAGGDNFDNKGNKKPFVIIKNGDSSSKTITVTAQTTDYEFGVSGDVTKSDNQVTVSANGLGAIGPFPNDAFNDSNGKVQLTYDAVTSLELCVVRIV